jgi:hypothetical protein
MEAFARSTLSEELQVRDKLISLGANAVGHNNVLALNHLKIHNTFLFICSALPLPPFMHYLGCCIPPRSAFWPKRLHFGHFTLFLGGPYPPCSCCCCWTTALPPPDIAVAAGLPPERLPLFLLFGLP